MYGCSRSFSIRRHPSMKKKVDDLNIMDGENNTHTLLNNEKKENRDVLASPVVESEQTKYNDYNQNLKSEGVSRRLGE